MKFLRFNLIFINLFLLGASCDYVRCRQPQVVVVLMVKNEAHVLQATLQPFLDVHHQEIVVFDTGSTDGTPQLAQQLFLEYDVQYGYVAEKPFVDFATSRNDALVCAEEKFPNAHFFLMIDAEWHVQNVEGLLEFCKQELDSNNIAFLIDVRSNYHNYVCRLLRAHRGLRFVGVVHECINYITRSRVPDDVYINWTVSRKGIEQSRIRWKRDCDLLLLEHKKNPHDLRTLFYLGQTYACLGNHKEAIVWYEKRCQYRGWDQEDFMAHYRLAEQYDLLGNWNQALFYYIKAYGLRPSRVEPLVCIAQHYWIEKNYAIAFLFAQQATLIPHSDQEVLFIDQKMYDFTRYDILGIVAWYLGEYDIGEQAVLKALQYYPDSRRLLSNLSLYKKKKENCR